MIVCSRCKNIKSIDDYDEKPDGDLFKKCMKCRANCKQYNKEMREPCKAFIEYFENNDLKNKN
jgi:hypothetical protein